MCPLLLFYTGALLQTKVMSGKVLLTWRHHGMRLWCRQRYLGDRDSLQAAHAAIASLFFSEFIAEGDIADLAEGDSDALASAERRRTSTPHAVQVSHWCVAFYLFHWLTRAHSMTRPAGGSPRP